MHPQAAHQPCISLYCSTRPYRLCTVQAMHCTGRQHKWQSCDNPQVLRVWMLQGILETT